jgi:uncharacterized protein YggU (UPF0235/DUF167 family)
MTFNISTTYRVKVKTEEMQEGVTLAKDGRLLVSVKAKREEGRANERCVKLLAQYFRVSDEDVSIIRGHAQSTKTVLVHGS